jgi:hypothetical protein
MEKTTLGLIAALGAAAVAPTAAHASASAVENIRNPRSVAELLEPVPNAVATMNALNAGERTLEPVEVAEVGITIGPGGVRIGHRHHHHYRYYHHHHHHHHHWRRYHHHHHHHRF